MVEIIPNWHPLLVHFTVALWIISFVFYLLAMFFGGDALKQQWRSVARWNLWSGMLLTVFTLLAGWYAYNTVNHDTASHAAMTVHRNWALVTATLYTLLSVWSVLNYRRGQGESGLFVVLMLVASLLLSSTAWRGGELVYRHGMGVMSLPASGEHEHGTHGEDNSYGHGHDAMEEGLVHDDSPVHGHEEADGHHHDHSDHKH